MTHSGTPFSSGDCGLVVWWFQGPLRAARPTTIASPLSLERYSVPPEAFSRVRSGRRLGLCPHPHHHTPRQARPCRLQNANFSGLLQGALIGALAARWKLSGIRNRLWKQNARRIRSPGASLPSLMRNEEFQLPLMALEPRYRVHGLPESSRRVLVHDSLIETTWIEPHSDQAHGLENSKRHSQSPLTPSSAQSNLVCQGLAASHLGQK